MSRIQSLFVSTFAFWGESLNFLPFNPCDHPHGGGEGRSPIGRSRPVTPWGKPTLGKKTRTPKRYSNIYIVRSRKTS